MDRIVFIARVAPQPNPLPIAIRLQWGEGTVSRGNWLGPVRAIALSLTTLVLPGTVIALAAIVLGGSMLYPAWHEPLHGGFKALWLVSGLVTAGLAAIAIVAVARSRTDASISSDHIHDVAKLLFAFSTFWMYIWFSQAMLIWYTNMPGGSTPSARI